MLLIKTLKHGKAVTKQPKQIVKKAEGREILKAWNVPILCPNCKKGDIIN